MAVTVASNEAQDGSVTARFWALTLGSIGVVFGDIGTSPLYAFREAVAGAAQGQPATRVMVLGVLSLILWALLVVVTAKYVLLLLRADNNGEGGTLSLMALGQRALGRRSLFLLGLGVVGRRRSQARNAGARALCGAGDPVHPGRAVFGSE